MPGFTAAENQTMLEHEYENLMMGESLCLAFEDLAKEKNQPLPR